MTHSDQVDRAVVQPIPSTALASASPILEPPTPRREPGRRKGPGLGLIGLALAIGLGWVAWAWMIPAFRRPDERLQHLSRMTVSKVDLNTVLTAWGRVESSHKTVIACELERLEMRNAGKTISSGGASTILTLVDEGLQVKKGDVLCTLDASDYEELARTQEIKTEQAAAALKTAELSFDVAEIAVREFRDGLSGQQLQTYEGTIAMAQADVERAGDRLKWTEKMLGKGYTSRATRSNAERDLNQGQFDFMNSRTGLANFLEYGKTRTLMELSSEVEKRRFEVIANTLRVTRNREQLALYKRMVENCTIKAPHDGFLIYAYEPNKPNSGAIEPGQTVRQGQKLFFLPDMDKMEVTAYIHESVASRVREGMRARARIEGLGNRTIEGRVISVAPLPTNAGNWFSDEVKYFVGVVKLDDVPVGMKPGMTAEVEFDIDRRLDVLAVPSEAVAIEGGHNICYVAGIDGLERRPVTLGGSNRDLLEVTKGLAEGDQVVLRPEKVESIDSLVVHPAKDSGGEDAPVADSFAPSGAPVSVE